jgi:DNA-binding NarL/FixJ family response regulator
MRLVDAHSPHVILMDIRMPKVDGIAATAMVRRRPNPPEVLVLTTFDTDDHVVRALRAGASGFLLKDTAPAKIVAAIHAVANGEPVISPQVMRRLMDRVAVETGQHQKAQNRLRALSNRETEVVRAVARGLSNAEIGAVLFMSVATVKAHISSILSKLDLDNRTQIALLLTMPGSNEIDHNPSQIALSHALLASWIRRPPRTTAGARPSGSTRIGSLSWLS